MCLHDKLLAEIPINVRISGLNSVSKLENRSGRIGRTIRNMNKNTGDLKMNEHGFKKTSAAVVEQIAGIDIYLRYSMDGQLLNVYLGDENTGSEINGYQLNDDLAINMPKNELIPERIDTSFTVFSQCEGTFVVEGTLYVKETGEYLQDIPPEVVLEGLDNAVSVYGLQKTVESLLGDSHEFYDFTYKMRLAVRTFAPECGWRNTGQDPKLKSIPDGEYITQHMKNALLKQWNLDIDYLSNE